MNTATAATYTVGQIVLTRNSRQVQRRMVTTWTSAEIGTVGTDAQGTFYRMRKIGTFGPGGQIRWREADLKTA